MINSVINQENMVFEREKRGLTQRAVAKMIGIAQPYLCNLENFKQKLPEHIAERIEIELNKYDRQKANDERIEAIKEASSSVIKEGEPKEEKTVAKSISPVIDNQNHIYDVTFGIAEMLSNKNHDYGDSLFKIYEQFGDLYPFIRLTEKLGRMESLVKNVDPRVANESLEDTLRDIAGYCIMALVSKRRLKGE